MLVALWDVSNQFNDNNGSILTNGKIYVYYSGRAALAPTWSSADGSHVNSNPIILDNNGRAVAFADDQYTYTCVVCDFYGREMFSFDPSSYGTGGGGSSGEGGPAQHWIGKSASTVSVPKNIATTLPIPSNPDYEGDFASVIDNTFVLAPGLYMVDCLVDFRQSSSDLMNKMGSIKFYTSDSSDPIEGQIFERNETGPDASGDSHQVQVSFVRHVADVDDDALRFEMTSSSDLTYAKIDRLSIVKLEQGGGGMTYAAGYGIQIDGQVISTSGMMPESSAANFVDNSTYQVDIQNIYEAIAETSGLIPSGVATEQFVEDYTSAFITEDALDGYATQQWVEDQNFITSADIPDIPEDIITSGELATVSGDIVAQIPSLDGYATEQWVVEQGYITSADLPQSVPLVAGEGISIVDTSASTIISVDSAYSPGVSEEWVEEYVSDATSAFITSADIPPIPQDVVTSGELATVSGEIVNQIPDVSDMATKTWVNEQGFITSLPEDLVTSGELATVSGDIMSQIPSQTTVSIDPTLQTGTKIAEFNINGTSGELFAPNGGSTYTAGSHIDITNNEISVAGVSGLLAGENVTITTSAGNYYINSTGGGDVPADVVTSGQLATVSGNIMNEIPNYTAGDNISIVNDVISVDETAGLIAGSNINITASGDSYVISSNGGGGSGSDVDIIPSLSSGTKIADYVIDGTSGELYAPAGGGSVTFPLEVSGSTNVYEARDGLTYGYANAGEIYVGYHDDQSEPVENVTISTHTIAVKNYSRDPYHPVMTQVYADHIDFVDEEESSQTVDLYAIRNWYDTYDAVNNSAAYWNSAYNAVNDSASYWNDAAGMNEYPISAGPGMSIEDVSGVTVFGPDVPYLTQAVGADETVIYNGKLPNLNGNLTLSESWNNFKQIRVRGGDNTPEDHYYSSVSPSKAAFKISWAYNWMNEAYLKFSATSDPKVWTYAANTYVHYTHTDSAVFVSQNDTVTLGSGCNFKVVGIGRISGGN